LHEAVCKYLGGAHRAGRTRRWERRGRAGRALGVQQLPSGAGARRDRQVAVAVPAARCPNHDTRLCSSCRWSWVGKWASRLGRSAAPRC